MTIASQTDMRDWLYARIPAATRARDTAAGHPLRDFLAVSAVAFYELHQDVQKLLLLVDAEQCEASLLPQLGSMLGFEFPYDLTEQQQRAFIKFMVNIYRVKGTAASLKLVANRLIGNGFDLVVENEDVAGHTFDISITAATSSAASAAWQTKLQYVLASVTPAGLIPTLALAFFFDEIYPDTVVDNEFAPTDFETTFWQWNNRFHTLNGTILLNTSSTTAVDLYH